MNRPDSPTPARDRLALIRTELANERTLLSYLRTGLALVVGAITARHFLEDPVIRLMGAVIGIVGALAVAFGVGRYLLTRRMMTKIVEGER